MGAGPSIGSAREEFTCLFPSGPEKGGKEHLPREMQQGKLLLRSCHQHEKPEGKKARRGQSPTSFEIKNLVFDIILLIPTRCY